MTLEVPSVRKGDWTRLRIIIDKLKHLSLGVNSHPTFAGLTLQVSGASDATQIFKTANHQMNVYLDESLVGDEIVFEGQTAAKHTQLMIAAQDGQNATLYLRSGSLFSYITHLSDDRLQIANNNEDEDIFFQIDDGGVTKTITWDADVDKLKHSAGLFNFDDDNITTTGIGTFAGLTVTGSSVHGLNSAVFQPTTDSTTFFQVLDADGGTPVFNVDSTNERVGIGIAAPTVGLDLYEDNGGAAYIKIGNPTGSARLVTQGDVLYFQVPTTIKMTLTSTGRLGIGITSPQAMLDIVSPSGTIPFKFTQANLASNNPTLALFYTTDGLIGQLFATEINATATFGFIAGTGIQFIVAANNQYATPHFLIDTSGNIGINELIPETLTEWTGTAPYLTLHNSTHEDTDGGRESRINFKGEQGVDPFEETTLARIEVSHDGTGADDKGKLVISINDGDDGDTPTQALEIGSDLLVTSSGVIRGATSLWWRIQHIDLSALPATGAVGAVYTPQSANNLNGYQLDNAPSEEYLYFNTHVGTDWDEASDLEIVVQFETNVDNSLGAGTDTIDFDLLMYYKGDTETAQKTQDLDASVVVGTAAQFYHSSVTFTIDHDLVDHVVQIGDCVSFRLHLNTTDSEVDNVIVHHAMFRYKTNKVRAEV